MNVQRMCRIALMAALICVAAPLAIPVGAVPITLATFAVYLAGFCLGPWEGTAAVAIYLLLGAVGVPVFSGFSGGAARLVGATGGYLWGYLPCALLTGLAAKRYAYCAWKSVAGMVVGTAVLYAIGTAWFLCVMPTTFAGAMASCVLPFLPGDALKIAAAQIVGRQVKKRLKKFL